MIICNPRSLAFALLIAALPVGFALAGGSGGRGGAALGGGVGAAGMGSAGVGGGAPAGAVGGGPPAGAVGGGSPGSGNPAGNGAAGTGNPSRNAGGSLGSGTNASPGITSAKRSRKRLAPRRTWPRCRTRTPSDATPYRSRSTIATDRCRPDCLRGSQSSRLAARSEIVESGHFLLMSSVDEQAAPHYLWID